MDFIAVISWIKPGSELLRTMVLQQVSCSELAHFHGDFSLRNISEITASGSNIHTDDKYLSKLKKLKILLDKIFRHQLLCKMIQEMHLFKIIFLSFGSCHAYDPFFYYLIEKLPLLPRYHE